MHVGHLDGRGTVYDESGKPLLGGSEQLLRHIPNDNIDVTEGSGFWNMKTLFPHTPEGGDFYLTNSRILFLRKPDPGLAFRGYNYPGGLGDAVADAYKAQSLSRARAMAYCEIDLNEIEGFWVNKRNTGVLFLRSDSRSTRKAIIYRRGSNDDKFEVLGELLRRRLSITQPEDKKGSYVLGAKYPFLHRRA